MNSAMDSAMNQVLDSPELLEMILVQMDMRSLLTSAQRVCLHWASLINSSPSIQKALFFTPIKESEWGADEKTPNPLLAETFPSIFPARGRTDRFRFDFSDMAITKDASTMARFVRKEASWRRMLVQQPPIRTIGLFHISHGMVGDRAGTSSILPDSTMRDSGYDGIRMERLFELLIFSKRVQFLFNTRSRVYWSCEEPIPFKESSARNNELFYQMLNTFDLMLYTREVIQCVQRDDPPSADELTRREIIAAWREHGLDVRAKRKEIEMAETKETLLN